MFLSFGGATSFTTVRGWLIEPLYVHDGEASGEIAYVMADGEAVWERLRAASDLYHMHRVEKIALLDEQQTSSYNFVKKQNDTRVQREIDYLGLYGVPAEDIVAIRPILDDPLSSRSEAIGLQREFLQLQRIVVVTSAPHTRRSLMCFERVFGETADVTVYSASPPSESAETYYPIWIEYCKLIVYWFSI
ncbi:YdcF family protein [Rhodopirellula sp. SWK7]|uniref:YdcF family protein n=1 Tax=Rhodopirellula sp. SWK7 TaxID=595460 RepID=UPI0002BDD880|nr:YdcF family protein [Rhodopirellula sp. SWK7]EMI44573.1 hypothetical protein RRSWK_02639 [Rhodopirellula sp. SWK7]